MSYCRRLNNTRRIHATWYAQTAKLVLFSFEMNDQCDANVGMVYILLDLLHRLIYLSQWIKIEHNRVALFWVLPAAKACCTRLIHANSTETDYGHIKNSTVTDYGRIKLLSSSLESLQPTHSTVFIITIWCDTTRLSQGGGKNWTWLRKRPRKIIFPPRERPSMKNYLKTHKAKRSRKLHFSIA